MPPKTKDFSAGVYTGLKSCPPHPAVDRAVQTDACLLPVGPMVISDDALRAALRARGLVGIPLEDLERQIIANIALHLRLDPTHSMEMLFTMWRVPRAVVDKLWGRWTPSQQDNDVILYEWLEIERVMNLVNLEPHLKWGMKNAKLHKVSAPKSAPILHAQMIFSHKPPAPVHRWRRRSSAGPSFSWRPELPCGTPRRTSSCGSAPRCTTSPT